MLKKGFVEPINYSEIEDSTGKLVYASYNRVIVLEVIILAVLCIGFATGFIDFFIFLVSSLRQ